MLLMSPALATVDVISTISDPVGDLVFDVGMAQPDRQPLKLINIGFG
jgi:hypothetical protein